MTYEEAVRYLLTLGSELAAPRHPLSHDFSGARAAKLGLRNITLLADRLGNPHRASPCVHVAGTNGKGSTAAMLDSILRAAGLRTGLYTSPHLERINERIRVHGQELSEAAFAEAFTRVSAYVEVMLASGTLSAHPTYFECLTAMAFDVFARERLDVAVYEVGMGGRLDATNIVTPDVAVITPIDFDHENYLGHSIEQIAGEKAGIIKQGARVVSAAERPEARAVIRRRCAEQGAQLVEIAEAYRVEPLSAEGGRAAGEEHPRDAASARAPAGVRGSRVALHHRETGWTIELTLPLLGGYQVRNAVAAVAAARVLAGRGFLISDAALGRGIASVSWPGRLELVQAEPMIFLDGTHNPAGARELLAFWEEQLDGRRIHLVYGAVRDKAVDEIAGLLFPRAASLVLTQARQPRAISAAALREMTSHLAPHAEAIADAPVAVERAIARAGPDDVVFVTGSLYLAGDLRRYWRTRSSAAPRAVGRAS